MTASPSRALARPDDRVLARLALARGAAAPLDWAARAIDQGYLLEPRARPARRKLRRLRRAGLLS